MDSQIVTSLALSLSLILPILVLVLMALLYVNIVAQRRLSRIKQRVEERTLSTRRNNKRLYLIDRERK